MVFPRPLASERVVVVSSIAAVLRRNTMRLSSYGVCICRIALVWWIQRCCGLDVDSWGTVTAYALGYYHYVQTVSLDAENESWRVFGSSKAYKSKCRGGVEVGGNQGRVEGNEKGREGPTGGR
jgi:hypothetical protein